MFLLAVDRADVARILWFAGVVPTIAALVWEIVQSLRRGEVGVDIVAALSMTAALAFGEELAASVVAVMYAGGTFLESFAESRARHEMHALLSRVPRSATRHRDGALEEVPLDAIAPGDRLLIRQGDAVPVDGLVADGSALVDTSALTGEPLPVRVSHNGEVMSGATNVGEAFDLLASHPAAESTYAGIVRLVEAAQRSKAPMARMADRWSLGFLAVTLVLAAMAWWASDDPVRAVAVLVVATPCPLILAVPVALVGGMSRASRFGVLIKGARILENLSRIRTVILDKTGTLTIGQPSIVEIRPTNGMSEDELLALAAALDQASKHPVAQAIVAEALSRNLTLPVPSGVTEFPGEGVAGDVAGRAVKVGGLEFVSRGRVMPTTDKPPGSVVVAVEIDGEYGGLMVMADNLRTEAGALLASMRRLGVERILLATGDRSDVANTISTGLGLDAVHAELTPDQKVLLVLTEHKNGPVMMVGDGVNDAPALAAADVGVAMGARGAAASAEAADIVLLVDRIDAVLAALDIAQHSRRIAWQSIAAGIGLSVVGMIAAAFGYLSPVQGALLQEAIDVAVVLNALRSLRIRPRSGVAS